MAQRKTLNDAQVTILRWIGEGCPGGVMSGFSHRITAAALANRGLIRTSGHGPSWHAEITPAGTAYLQEVDSAHPPQPRQPNISVTQQLIDDLVAAGGTLRLPRKRWDNSDAIDYERRARLAQTHGKVPAGYLLRIKPLSYDEVLLELTPAPAPEAIAESPAALQPLSVPKRLTKPHPTASEFRDRSALHEVSRALLPRVTRIVHALAVEAENRGYVVRCVELREDGWGRAEWNPARDGQLLFTINGHQLAVRIWEKGCGQRGPYERRLRNWQNDRAQPTRLMLFVERPKAYDAVATGELQVQALGPSMGRQHTWGDRKHLRLEERLLHLLQELELEAAELDERDRERERQRVEREQQWNAAMERAKERLVDDHRLAVLRTRVEAWQQADSIRAYCDAVEKRHGASAADGGTAEWLKLARAYADRLQELPQMPTDPEFTPELLKPYLGTWSPYGPQ